MQHGCLPRYTHNYQYIAPHSGKWQIDSINAEGTVLKILPLRFYPTLNGSLDCSNHAGTCSMTASIRIPSKSHKP